MSWLILAMRIKHVFEKLIWLPIKIFTGKFRYIRSFYLRFCIFASENHLFLNLGLFCAVLLHANLFFRYLSLAFNEVRPDSIVMCFTSVVLLQCRPNISSILPSQRKQLIGCLSLVRLHGLDRPGQVGHKRWPCSRRTWPRSSPSWRKLCCHDLDRFCCKWKQ